MVASVAAEVVPSQPSLRSPVLRSPPPSVKADQLAGSAEQLLLWALAACLAGVEPDFAQYSSTFLKRSGNECRSDHLHIEYKSTQNSLLAV